MVIPTHFERSDTPNVCKHCQGGELSHHRWHCQCGAPLDLVDAANLPSVWPCTRLAKNVTGEGRPEGHAAAYRLCVPAADAQLAQLRARFARSMVEAFPEASRLVADLLASQT